MKVSLNWLSELIPHGRTADEVADLLTMSGLEVEEVETTGATVPDGVVVGRVLTAERHPNADRLTLTTVDVGGEAPLSIVCGAPNVAAGQTVAVAPPGTTLTLPGKDGPVTVTLDRRKIRGEVSEGMICAEDELGLGGDHSGILVLPDGTATPGEAFNAVLARTRGAADTVLTLNITPNRPDATSHVGVARDLAALTGAALTVPSAPEPTPGGKVAGRVSVRIDDPALCTRYVAMLVEGVTVGPSPAWLRERLEGLGARSVNNVVDVTNLVLRELGQPLHAFDLDRVDGATITVRAAREGERITTLDGKDRALKAGTPVIADGGEGGPRGIAVAGVMGGADTEVTEATTRVLIESAHFDPSAVRKAARSLGLSTDASYRFERGVDPEGTRHAAARAAALIAELADGTVVEGCVDVVARPHVRPTVALRLARLDALLGASIPAADVRRLLTAIGFETREDGDLGGLAEQLMEGRRPEETSRADVLRLTVPPWRPDVTREVDVIEEVARLWGLDRLPEPPQVRLPLAVPPPPGPTEARSRLRDALVGMGLHEVVGTSLVRRAEAERVAFAHPAYAPGEIVETVEPAGSTRPPLALRPSLLASLLPVASHNQRQRAASVRLFEVGHVVGGPLGKTREAPPADEREHAAVVLAGLAHEATWDAHARKVDVFDAKAAAESIVATYGQAATFLPCSAVGLDDALTVEVSGQPVGLVGRAGKALLDATGLRPPVVVAEVNTTALAALPRVARMQYSPFPRTPHVERDLAFVLDAATPVGAVVATAFNAGQPLVADVRVFDLYTGEHVGEGRKSVALALRLVADRTLTDTEVEAAVSTVVAAVERTHGATLRR